MFKESVIFVFYFIVLICNNLKSQEIVIESNFEGGNAELIESDYENNTLFIEPELKNTDTQRIWFYFKARGLKTDTLFTLRIKYERALYTPDELVYSYDNKNWHRLRGYDHLKYKQYSTSFNMPVVYFATGYPYLYTDLMQYLHGISPNPNLNIVTLTISEEGRPVPILRITDKNTPDQQKDLVWLIARQHAFEVPASHLIEGLIDFAVSEDSLAQVLRQKAIVYIVPMVDVDNVVTGGTGKNQKPVDINRDWHTRSESHWNAIAELRNLIEKTALLNSFKIFIDFHSPYPVRQQNPYYFNIYGENSKSKRLETFFDIYKSFAGYRPKEYTDSTWTKNVADEFIDNNDCIKYGTPCHFSMQFSFTYEQTWHILPNGHRYSIADLKDAGKYFGKALGVYMSK